MTTSYDKWKTTTRSAGNLFLDAENPRLAPGGNYSGERELIQELVRHEKVLELADSIAKGGFFPSEHLILVQEGSRNVVVEGNRRLAACKILLNPSLAPKEFEKKARAVSANFDAKSLAKVPVCISPSREAAIPLIIARHTSPQIEKWEPAMQANFYASLIDKGLSIEDIALRFGVKVSDVRSTLHAHNLYKMACRLDLKPEETATVRDPRQFKLTTLARVFENQTGRHFFGIELDANGGINGVIPDKEFEKGFKRLVRDIVTGDADSRKLHDTNDLKRYLGAFKADKPDKSKAGSFDSSSFLAGRSTKVLQPLPRPIKRAKRKIVGLIPSSVTTGIQNARLRNLLEELQQLSPARFPNATMVTFRTLLEIALFCFLDARRELPKIRHSEIARLQNKGNQHPFFPPHWAPSLNLMLEWVSDQKSGLIQNPHVLKALPKVMKDNEELFAFNLATHNSSWHPSETKLRDLWNNLEGFFKEILQ